MDEKITVLVRILSGLAGAILLYREVKISHWVEEYRHFLQSKNWLWLREMSSVYQKDLREFYKRFSIDGLNFLNPPIPQETIVRQQNFIDQMTDEEIREKLLAQRIYGESIDAFMSNLPAKIEHHDKLSSEGGMKQRKRLLNLGIVLIIISAGIDIILTLMKQA